VTSKTIEIPQQFVDDYMSKYTDEERAFVETWCRLNFHRSLRKYSRTSSYGFKHEFAEDSGGFYMMSHEFTVAMQRAGHDLAELVFGRKGDSANGYFRVSRPWLYAKRDELKALARRYGVEQKGILERYKVGDFSGSGLEVQMSRLLGRGNREDHKRLRFMLKFRSKDEVILKLGDGYPNSYYQALVKHQASWYHLEGGYERLLAGDAKYYISLWERWPHTLKTDVLGAASFDCMDRKEGLIAFRNRARALAYGPVAQDIELLSR
jgi:hypothetical protein